MRRLRDRARQRITRPWSIWYEHALDLHSPAFALQTIERIARKLRTEGVEVDPRLALAAREMVARCREADTRVAVEAYWEAAKAALVAARKGAA